MPSNRTYVGVFTLTGDLAIARSAHTATLLPSGRVLIAGGAESGSLTTLASSELYEPATGTFTRTSDLTAARFAHTATLLSSGHVLIAGGFNPTGGSNALASAELYDPASGTFTPTGDLTVPRWGHAATLLRDGRVLITGGSRIADVGLSALASAELYDPANGTFTATGDLTVPRLGHTATLLPDGRVLIAGGIESRGTNLLASAELYDPEGGSFTRVANLTVARAMHTATLLLDGRVLIAGGTDVEGVSTIASAELYDPASGAFTRTGDMSVPRFAHTATLLPDGRVFIAGGLLGGGALASAELYDPVYGAFTLTGFLTVGRAMHTATLLPDEQVLVAGGAQPSDRRFAAAELFQ